MSGAGIPPDPNDPLFMRAGQAAPAPPNLSGQNGLDPLAIRASGAEIPGPHHPPLAPANTPQDWRTQLMGSPIGSVMHGGMDAVRGLDQLLYKGGEAVTTLGGNYPNANGDFFKRMADTVSKAQQEEDAYYAKARAGQGQTGFDFNRLLGNVISPANAPLAAISGPSALARSVLQGAGSAAIQPVQGEDYWKQKLGDIDLGAISGGVLHTTGAGLSAVANPVIDNGKQLLIDAGVPMTVGQIMGGPVKAIENAATSIPFVGDIIKNRYRDSAIGLNTAAFNRALAPVGEKLPAGLEGHAAAAHVAQTLGDKYKAIIPHLSGTPDPQLASELNGLVNNAGPGYSVYGDTVPKLQDYIKDLVIEPARANGGVYSGQAIRDVQEGLSNQIGRLETSNSPQDKNLADALIDAKGHFDNFIARQNPSFAPELKAINTGWANFVRPRAAAAAAMNTGGRFSVGQLAQAVGRGVPTWEKAQGEALMQDLQSAASEHLPSTIPDSGTPFRHAVQAGVGLGAAMLGGEHFVPGAANAALGAATLGTALGLGGTKPAQALARALLVKRPYSKATAAQLGAALRQLGTGAVGIGGLLAGPATNPGPK